MLRFILEPLILWLWGPKKPRPLTQLQQDIRDYGEVSGLLVNAYRRRRDGDDQAA